MNKPLTTGEIAEYCHVTHRAVLKWVESGKLKAYRTPGNHSRVSIEDFLKFLHEYKMPIPAELKSFLPKKKILIVDDDRGMVHSLQRMFMLSDKYAIEVAFDGFEAGEKFAGFRPDFIILDILMPGMNGYEVCSYIRKDPRNDKVKILAISGLSDPKEIQKIIDAGANDFLEKPFDHVDLQKKIEVLMG